jgi:hypothetical protein
MGGGVLPIAFYKGRIFFLFSRECINSKEDGGLWSDFGGSKDNNENYTETAIRECFEESDNILGSKKQIEKLVNNSIKTITLNGYRTHIVIINFDINLPKKFRKNFLNVKKNNPHLINKKNGLYEKDMIKWMSYNDMKNNKNIIFRPWYKKFINHLLKLF